VRPAAVAGLLAADTLFVWMFLAAAPLERMAVAGHFAGGSRLAVDAAFAFAADWRHGMAGNSPLYMPGFFALAAATWVWCDHRRWPQLAIERAASLAGALMLAWLAAPFGTSAVVDAFASAWQTAATSALPQPGLHAAAAGCYTALAWSVFVGGCRQALLRRTWWPLAPAPVLAVVLAAARPWTVGDFTALWLSRAGDADAVAVGSLLAIPATSAVLAAYHRRRSSHPDRREEAAHRG
jgi:hypothetical protein